MKKEDDTDLKLQAATSRYVAKNKEALKEDLKQMFKEDDEVMETWNTDTAHKASFRQQQHQIDMLVTIINEFTEESTALAKAMEHIVRRLDNIEKFLDQVSQEAEKDNDVNRIVN